MEWLPGRAPFNPTGRGQSHRGRRLAEVRGRAGGSSPQEEVQRASGAAVTTRACPSSPPRPRAAVPPEAATAQPAAKAAATTAVRPVAAYRMLLRAGCPAGTKKRSRGRSCQAAPWSRRAQRRRTGKTVRGEEGRGEKRGGDGQSRIANHKWGGVGGDIPHHQDATTASRSRQSWRRLHGAHTERPKGRMMELFGRARDHFWTVRASNGETLVILNRGVCTQRSCIGKTEMKKRGQV